MVGTSVALGQSLESRAFADTRDVMTESLVSRQSTAVDWIDQQSTATVICMVTGLSTVAGW